MRLVRSIAVCAALFAASPAFGAEPEGADAAREVISSQLDAFRSQDLPTAFSHASPIIQRKFLDPDTFGAMVRGGYPMVWAPSMTEFLDAEPYGGGILQRLRIVDQAGQPHIAEYLMTRIDGEWRISGVRILRDDSYGV